LGNLNKKYALLEAAFFPEILEKMIFALKIF